MVDSYRPSRIYEFGGDITDPSLGVAEAHSPLICAEAHNPAFRWEAGSMYNSVEVPDGYIAEYVLGDPNPMLIQISGHRHVQPHQARVITESQYIATRLTALQAFIKSDSYQSVDTAEQGRLLRQELLMVDLLAVLNERIAAW
jgi:hypothetical protein